MISLVSSRFINAEVHFGIKEGIHAILDVSGAFVLQEEPDLRPKR